MKRLFITILLLTVCSIHGQTDEKELLKSLNQALASARQNRNTDEALKLSHQIVNLSVKIYGKESLETATAYSNLGILYRNKRNYKESINNLRQALEICQKLPDSASGKLVEILETLALSLALDKRKEEAEASYLTAIEIAENKFGKESKESFSPTLNLANFYAREKKIDAANEFYLKSYTLAVKRFGIDGTEFEITGDSRACLVIAEKNDSEKEKAFQAAKEKIIAENVKSEIRIITGRVLSLPEPPYPRGAELKGIKGKVLVRVRIDEEGNVTEAKTVCGAPVFARLSEEAALKAKFAPTIIDGKSFEVRGVIVYNFGQQ